MPNKKVTGIFEYLDDVTICDENQTEHAYNLKRFMTDARKCNLTLYEEKCVFSTKSVKCFGIFYRKPPDKA